MLEASGRTLWDVVRSRCDAATDAEAFADESGRRITYGQLADDAEAVAAGLAGEGVTAGDVVAWQLPTWIESFVLLLALSRLGAVQVPLLPTYRQRELRHVLSTTSAVRYVGPGYWSGTDYRELLTDATAGSVPSLRMTFLGEDRRLPTGDPTVLPPAPTGADDAEATRWIYHTSGTTSEPKGAKHCDRSVLAAARGWALSAAIDDRDVLPCVFPMTHIGGAVVHVAGLLSGCRTVLSERWEPASIDVLVREGCTLPGGAQVLLLAFIEEQRRRGGGRLFEQARAFTSGGAAKNPEVHHILQRELGAGVLANYGMTECPMATTSPFGAPDDELAAAEGVPSEGVELRVVDPAGAPLAPGEVGQVALRGAQLFQGYVDPALDEGAFDADGYLLTGDLGVVDGRGFLRIVGRVKDVIIRKGENISAKEIEDLLFEHPSVREVAVVGLPDDRVGERCCAVLVPDGLTGDLDPTALAEFLRAEGLMVQKIPEEWRIVDDMPRNAAGKVLKTELRRRFTASGATTMRESNA